MRTAIAFVVGLLVGSALVLAPSFAQGNRLAGVNGVNHAGINVSNFDDAMAFFTQKMGFPEAFRVKDDKGQIMLAYVQLNRNTFLEIQPAGTRPLGISHVGLHVDNIRATIATLKQRGVTVEEARVSGTQSLIANVTGPDGLRIELSELTPESLQRKAMDGWK